MPKNILQDIRPLTKKDHPVPRPHMEPEPVHDVPPPIPPRVHRREPQSGGDHKHHRPSIFLWLSLLVALGALFAGLSYFFAQATVTLTPKSAANAIDVTLEAKLSDKGAILPFEIMSVDGEESKTLESTSSGEALQKARGEVTIYNNYSPASQKLVVKTRLEDKSGKTFRIIDAVTVPGTHTEGGKTVPGSVTVMAEADVAGPDYNIGLADFTIPGLKGSPQFNKIYARSKTPMSGGAVGLVYSVAKEEVDTVTGELTTTLKTKLWEQAQAEVPKGYVVFEPLSVFNVSSGVISHQSATASVPVTVKGMLTVYLLAEDALAHVMAEKVMTDYEGGVVTVANMSELAVTTSLSVDADPKEQKTLSVHIVGTPKVAYVIPEEAVVDQLLGKTKSDFDSIMGSVTQIRTAALSIRPFWEKKIPDRSDRINVIINDPFR